MRIANISPAMQDFFRTVDYSLTEETIQEKFKIEATELWRRFGNFCVICNLLLCSELTKFQTSCWFWLKENQCFRNSLFDFLHVFPLLQGWKKPDENLPVLALKVEFLKNMLRLGKFYNSLVKKGNYGNGNASPQKRLKYPAKSTILIFIFYEPFSFQADPRL